MQQAVLVGVHRRMGSAPPDAVRARSPRIWCGASSPRPPRIYSGWRTSRTGRCGPTFFISRSCSTSSVGGSSSGPWAPPSKRAWCSTRWLEQCVMALQGPIGDCYDNAMAETFFTTLECELIGQLAGSLPRKPGRRSSATSKADAIFTGAIRRSGNSHPSTHGACAHVVHGGLIPKSPTVCCGSGSTPARATS